MAALPMKSVVFDGGLLRFRIPDGWVENPEQDGGTAFYPEALDWGTLRVKVMTFTSEQELAGDVAFEELGAMAAEPGQSLVALPNGNALRAHREQADSNGEPTVFFVWLLASIDPPHRMRLAVFSYAVLAPRAADLATRRLVTSLDREIRDAQFGHQVS